jgi:hypothetical protein
LVRCSTHPWRHGRIPAAAQSRGMTSSFTCGSRKLDPSALALRDPQCATSDGPSMKESIRFRGRSRSTPGPVISGDGRISSVYCNLPIAPGTNLDQPHHLAALAGFQRDHHRSTPLIHAGCL